MNQVAAAILVLAASICGYSASIRPSTDGFGGIMGLIALGLGLWGGLALLTSITTERDVYLDDASYEPMRPPALGVQRLRGGGPLTNRSADSVLGPASRDYRLSPEMNAQVSMAAQMNGRSRRDVVEDILHKNLPRYTTGRVA